jgi:hypothetical protein
MKIHLSEWTVKGKIAFENSLIFQARIEDLLLNCCIHGENPKRSWPFRHPST